MPDILARTRTGYQTNTGYASHLIRCGSDATATANANTLYAHPFLVPNFGLLGIALDFFTTTAPAGQNFTLGVYAPLSPQNMYPGAKIFDGADIVSAAGRVGIPGDWAISTPGLVWVAFNADTALVCIPCPSLSALEILGRPGSGSWQTTVSPGLQVARTWASTLPTPFPTASVAASNTAPMIVVDGYPIT